MEAGGLKMPVGATAQEKIRLCANRLLEGYDSWWQTLAAFMASAGIGAAYTGCLVKGGLAAGPAGWWGLAVGVGAGLGVAAVDRLGYYNARRICNMFVCTEQVGQPTCVCTPGTVWDIWTCRCPFGTEIYKPNDSGMYISNPGGGGNSVERWIR